MSTSEKHPDTQTAQSSSNREYKRVTREEFERGVADIAVELNITFKLCDYDWSKERIYESVIVDDFEDGELFIRIYSSLYRGVVRDDSRDAIRTVGMYRPDDEDTAYPVAVPETEYTKRIPTWKSNLKPDVKEVKTAIETRDFKRCDCGSLLCRREKEGTQIWGCINYPFCEHAKPAEGNPACPDCGEAMILRENSHNGSNFWGCIHFDDCCGTRNAPNHN